MPGASKPGSQKLGGSALNCRLDLLQFDIAAAAGWYSAIAGPRRIRTAGDFLFGAVFGLASLLTIVRTPLRAWVSDPEGAC